MKKLLLTLFCATFAMGAFAQSIRDVRINEVLVKNVDSYMDDYGHRSSWIELHNTEHGRLNVGGCYLRLVTNVGDTVRYRIPTGDANTEMGALSYTVFYCEGTGTKGTFYTNFTLDNVAAIALFDAGGDSPRNAKPIDEVFLNYDAMLPDVSVGRFKKEDGTYIFTELPQTTPNATNDTEPALPRHEQFRLRDPYGVVMAVSAVPIVLSVLTILFILFKLIGNYNVSLTRKKSAESRQEAVERENKYATPYTGDEIAAIVMALQLYQNDLHDKEATVVTINKVARAYSPWSSKIYGLSQFRKK